jgi:hypothetical protein
MATRRQFLKGAGVLAASSPFVAAHYLATNTPKPLPDARAGDVLTVGSWNALVRQVNELSRRGL